MWYRVGWAAPLYLQYCVRLPFTLGVPMEHSLLD